MMLFIVLKKALLNYILDSRIQILANLANFAYDPINYNHMRKLNVIDLFLGKLLGFRIHFFHHLLVVVKWESFPSFPHF